MANMSKRYRSDKSGFALITVLLAMALLTGIGAGLTAVGVVEFRTSVNHRSATQALLLADAGAIHAQALLRGALGEYTYTDVLLGPDGAPNTADDGVMMGFGLAASDELPDTGILLTGGRYFVTVENDAVDPSGDPFTDSNERILAVCRGETPDGGRAEVRVMLEAPAFPAIASNGDLALPGNPDIFGPCAGVHANRRLIVSGNPIVDGDATASDTAIVSGEIRDPYGNVLVAGYRPPIEIPEYDPLDYCGDADYVLRDGWVITVGPPRDSAQAGSGPGDLGWEWDSGKNEYKLAGNDAEPGTYCAYGNVHISGNPGETGSPVSMTILALGSVEVSGNPRLQAAHPDNILIMATGDVMINGNPYASGDNYSGMVYAGSQCMINGNPNVGGYLLCYDAPDPPGALNLLDENQVNGNPRFTYDCSGLHRRTIVTSWWEARTQ